MNGADEPCKIATHGIIGILPWVRIKNTSGNDGLGEAGFRWNM